MNSRIEVFQQLVAEYAADEVKFLEGNNAAGSRVRATMQTLKKLAQEVRKEVQAEKNARKASKA